MKRLLAAVVLALQLAALPVVAGVCPAPGKRAAGARACCCAPRADAAPARSGHCGTPAAPAAPAKGCPCATAPDPAAPVTPPAVPDVPGAPGHDLVPASLAAALPHAGVPPASATLLDGAGFRTRALGPPLQSGCVFRC